MNKDLSQLLVDPSEQFTDAVFDMLDTSFLLPSDAKRTLEALGWKIHPIQVVTAEEFEKSLPLLERLATSSKGIHYYPSKQLVLYSKFVGVSIRTYDAVVFNPLDRQVRVLAKMWAPSSVTVHKSQGSEWRSEQFQQPNTSENNND